MTVWLHARVSTIVEMDGLTIVEKGGESSNTATATAFTTTPIGVANMAWSAMVILLRHDLSEKVETPFPGNCVSLLSA